MSIRLLAKDLYRLQKEVEALEKKLQEASYDRKTHLEEQLRTAKAEKERLRRMLDGQIDRPGTRAKKTFS